MKQPNTKRHKLISMTAPFIKSPIFHTAIILFYIIFSNFLSLHSFWRSSSKKKVPTITGNNLN